MGVKDKILAKFRCPKCGSTRGRVKKLAMTGAGLFDRWMDWQRNKYCGYTEVYDAEVLEGMTYPTFST